MHTNATTPILLSVGYAEPALAPAKTAPPAAALGLLDGVTDAQRARLDGDIAEFQTACAADQRWLQRILTPSAYDSGSVTRCQGISKAGNSWARRILIEISWLWLRYQPQTALAQWYSLRTRGQSLRIRRFMLVALARKLAVVLWRYVETGVLPSGATLSRQAA